MGTAAQTARNTARVLLVDDDQRVLLFRIGLRPLLDRLLSGERPHPPVDLPWPSRNNLAE